MKTKILTLVALLTLAAGAQAQTYVYSSGASGISVTQTNTAVAFTNNHSGGTDAAFLAHSIAVSSRAGSANTCFLDYEDTAATTDDIPLAPGETFAINRGPGYHPASGWGGMGVICDTGETATFDIVATRYEVPTGASSITVEGTTSETTTLIFQTSDGTISALYPLKALTESSATPVVLMSVASGASCGGVLEYTVSTADATPNYQGRHGAFNFMVVNKAGAETCTIGAADETADGSVLAISSGGADTLTYEITCDTAPTNGVYLSFNAVSSLTQTSLNIKPRINLDPSAAGVCTAVAQ